MTVFSGPIMTALDHTFRQRQEGPELGFHPASDYETRPKPKWRRCTLTGRWAASEPEIQKISPPSELVKVILAPSQQDFTEIENRILAEALQTPFNKLLAPAEEGLEDSGLAREVWYDGTWYKLYSTKYAEGLLELVGAFEKTPAYEHFARIHKNNHPEAQWSRFSDVIRSAWGNAARRFK